MCTYDIYVYMIIQKKDRIIYSYIYIYMNRYMVMVTVCRYIQLHAFIPCTSPKRQTWFNECTMILVGPYPLSIS